MPQPLKAAIFDLGRVLIHIDIYSWLKYLFPNMDSPTAQQTLMKIVRTQTVRDFQTGRLMPEQFSEKIQAQLSLNIPFDQFRTIWCDIFQPMTGMDKLLADLSKSVPIGLLSDTDSLHWQYIQSHFPYVNSIKNPILSFKTGCLKPDPQMYLAAAKAVGFAPEQCFYTDDLPENVLGAQNTGMTSIQFQSPQQIKNELKNHFNLIF